MSDEPKPLIDVVTITDFQAAFQQAVVALHAAPFATEREKRKQYQISKDGRYFRVDGINYLRRDVRRMLNILRERAYSPTIEEATQCGMSPEEMRQRVATLHEMRERGIIVPRDHELVR